MVSVPALDKCKADTSAMLPLNLTAVVRARIDRFYASKAAHAVNSQP